GNGRFLIDSPGFSLFDAMDFGSRELAGFYPEMRLEGASCRFQDCSHTGEPGCFVEELLRDGTVSAGRYERYLKIYAELKEQERNRYK
ncbi:MAG: ribosome small subunit-dependent GTPase A, partial [Clostridia bacterium]|nr:ribosome small subunit-dependent GTPase A [Clostridia bacterium]